MLIWRMKISLLFGGIEYSIPLQDMDNCFMKEILLAIFSALIGALLQKFQNKFKGELLWLRRNERLITPNIGDPAIKIYYKTKIIKSLSVAKILLINYSQSALKIEDFPEGKGITIIGKEHCRILRIDVVDHTDTDNTYNTSISKDHTSAMIKFHHFNPGDAILLQIFHTGTSANCLHCKCNAAGITNIKKIAIYGMTTRDLIGSLIFKSMILFVLMGMGLSYWEESGWWHWVSLFPWAIGLMYVWLIIIPFDLQYRFKNWYKMAKKNNF